MNQTKQRNSFYFRATMTLSTFTKLRTLTLFIIIMVVASTRIIPHMPNFSPLGAVALFGGAYLTARWQAFMLPIAATWVGDLFLNNVIYTEYFDEFTWFYSGFYWQYGSYALIVLMGRILLRSGGHKTFWWRLCGGALGSSVLFFVVTNFGSWMTFTTYPPTWEGLVACYVAGIPFFRGTLTGDVIYAAVLFGGYALAQRRWTWLREARAV